MHELTVASSIRASLEDELAADADSVVVEAVKVQVGALTGIVPEALKHAWPHAVADSSLLAGATIDIEHVEAGIECTACGTISTTPVVEALRCPACRSPAIHIAGGDELDIVSVDLSDRGSATT